MLITVFCNPAKDDAWSPESVGTGIGGSEEAVIHMAPRLAARGHGVTVVHRAAGGPRQHAGVSWTSYEALPREPAEIGIVWRRAGLADRLALAPGAARHFYLWLHDLRPEDEVLAHLARYAKVMVLSRFHRNAYPGVPAQRIFLTGNGIDTTSLADPAPPRDPQLMVYGSCYSRGLRTLLDSWPRIREAVPEARLRVFYGWQSIAQIRPRRYARLHDHFERLMRQDGITHLGRISHAEVAREYAGAGLWAYPCSFPETSCISAMKAQAGGAVPVVIPTGALAETVRHGFRTMRSHSDYAGQRLPPRIIEEWLQALVGLLQSPERQARIRAAMVPDSRRRFDWANVVAGWEREFRARLTGCSRDAEAFDGDA